MKTLKVGLVGLGFMGHGHLDQYIRLEKEGHPVKLVAICDVDEKKFTNESTQAGNMGDLGKGTYDFSVYNLYNNMDDMIAKEELDYIDIALPTYLHARYAVKALNAGLHVLCEKPMALDPDQCRRMIEAAKKNNRRLMVAQCLRFWPAYEVLKQYAEEEKFGKPVCSFFCRAGSTPIWSYEDWLRDENLSGGCLLDQHVHDVDMINWVFGVPESVSTMGMNVHPGAGFDAVSTHYRYENGMVVNAQDDWSMNGDVPFKMLYRVNFERGSLVFEDGVVTAYPVGAPACVVETPADDGYYRELVYFTNELLSGEAFATATPESTRNTICIATAERISARNHGDWVAVEGTNQ